MRDQDVAAILALLALLAPDAHVFDLGGTWAHEGRDAGRRAIDGWFGSLGDERVEVELADTRATVLAHAFVT